MLELAVRLEFLEDVLDLLGLPDLVAPLVEFIRVRFLPGLLVNALHLVDELISEELLSLDDLGLPIHLPVKVLPLQVLVERSCEVVDMASSDVLQSGRRLESEHRHLRILGVLRVGWVVEYSAVVALLLTLRVADFPIGAVRILRIPSGLTVLGLIDVEFALACEQVAVALVF